MGAAPIISSARYNRGMEGAVYILGAGSIGLLLATHLAGQRQVRLLRRAGAAAATAAFVLEQEGRRRELRLEQLGCDAVTSPIDELIVCTKAYDALSALESLRPQLGSAKVLLMQNGMGSQDEIAAVFPELRLHAACSTEGAFRPDPGTVVHAGRGITRIGALQGPPHAWSEMLDGAGLAAETVADIHWHLANKLRVNALINPLTVRYHCRNGQLLTHPQAVVEMRRLGEEADAVLAAAGFTFPEAAAELATTVARATAANVSSMAQDARAGRRLEIDHINGYLVRLGAEHGVPAPAHAAICRALTGLP